MQQETKKNFMLEEWNRFAEEDERYFIINKMYTGSYLDENDSQNIGHEVVNLFSDDNGDNYIYISPGGIIPSKYTDKVDYVFLTKQYDKGCQEVLGIAEVGEQLIKEPMKKYGPIEKQANKYKNQVKYYGQSLKKIFRDNRYNGKEDSHFENPVLTFKSEKFYLPKQGQRIIIAEENSPIKEDGATICRLPRYTFGHQSLRFYISNTEDKTKRAFIELEKLLSNKNLFDRKMPDQIGLDKVEKYGKEALSYLEVMGKIDSENIYSNLLSYFMKQDRNLLRKFCKALSSDLNINEKQAKIEREKHGRTDIWIEDNNNVIVVENKIQAGLSRPNQLKDYRLEAEKVANGRKISCFILAPNHYSKIKLDKNDSCDSFKMIRYSKIHRAFENCTLNISGEDDNYMQKINLYYDDFLRALSIHGYGTKSAKQESVERLFYKRLFQLSRRRKDDVSDKGDKR